MQWKSCLPSCKSISPLWHTFSSQSSSICKAAIHAGAIKADGGFVDVLPLDKRKHYAGVLKNGIQSERYYTIFCHQLFLL